MTVVIVGFIVEVELKPFFILSSSCIHSLNKRKEMFIVDQ